MAINDISLTAGMRSNLLSLQNTVTLLNRTQNRLSSGNKVNTALDNPTSYFTAQGLNSRASQIDSLKDAMGQAIQTVTAADKGIKGITSLIEQAKGIAQSALSAEAGASSTLSTTGANEFIAGTVSIDLTGMQSFDAGEVSIDIAGMTSFVAQTLTLTLGASLTYGQTIEIGGQAFVFTDAVGAGGLNFSDEDELALAITTALGAEGYEAVNLLGDITLSRDLVSLTDGMITGTATDTGVAIAVTEVAGSTLAVTGITDAFVRGLDFTDAASLVTVLSTAGYTTSTSSGTVVTASKDLETVLTTEFTAAAATIGISTTEVLGDTITFGGATYTAGIDFTDAASLVTILSDTGGYTASTSSGTVITAATDETTVLTSAFSEVGAITITTGTAEDEATTFTINGGVYTVGEDFAVGADDAATATNLAAFALTLTGVSTAVTSGTPATTVTVTLDSTELETLQDQYNVLLEQITALAEDSGYKGKNLISATAVSRLLTVQFEGATLDVQGSDSTSAGLGLIDSTWVAGTGNSIDDDIVLLDAALTTLRSSATSLSGNLSIITVRQDFSTNMINTLNEGSNKLTLADTNEEGANMLMLQTRQSLSTTALSLSAQAAQSVLRLFQ